MLARVLLVEHDATIGGELESGLREHGCEVTRLEDGEAGLARAARDRFDIILLSDARPDMSGFRLCDRLKMDPVTRGVATLVMSSSATDVEAHRRLAPTRTAISRSPSGWPTW